jgi:hypothetical protein
VFVLMIVNIIIEDILVLAQVILFCFQLHFTLIVSV